MAKHKVTTTDAEIDRAIARAESLKGELRVRAVEYRPSPGLDLLILKLSDGHRLLIPREDLEGLQSATRAQIAQVEILGTEPDCTGRSSISITMCRICCAVSMGPSAGWHRSGPAADRLRARLRSVLRG